LFKWLRAHDDLDAAERVFDVEERHRVAHLRSALPVAFDRAADGDLPVVWELGCALGRRIAKAKKLAAIPVQGVPRNVEAEGAFLPRELVPRIPGIEHREASAGVLVNLRLVFTAHQAEQALLAARTLCLDALASLDRRFDGDERLGAMHIDGLVDRIECPALHERFDHALVHPPEVDPRAEIKKVDERAFVPVSAFFLDGVEVSNDAYLEFLRRVAQNGYAGRAQQIWSTEAEMTAVLSEQRRLNSEKNESTPSLLNDQIVRATMSTPTFPFKKLYESKNRLDLL